MKLYPMRALTTGVLVLAIGMPVGVASAVAPADGMHPLRSRTLTDLDTAMRGEAYAYSSYSLFADQAAKQGLPAVKDLFRRTAKTELDEHFTEEAAMRGLVGGDADNLRAAIEGERYESLSMYPTFAKQAKQDGDSAAAELFGEIARDEAKHHAAFEKALEAVRTGKGGIPAPPSVQPVSVQAGMPKVHAARTKQNLDTAMHGEALAYAKYTHYAKAATAHGKQALARLFNGTAEIERREHFAGEAQLAGTVRSTRENLTKAITGEQYEARSMYPGFAQQAKATGDSGAAELLGEIARDEAKHARAFEVARDKLR
ncbi:ferritin family protein [Streptomyces sp. NPDC014733]|uniref:ferritin family protein n=1 Tax=Streptomyces sp. NPDC014733 TaxID=3364885 RepID=UPI0036FDCFE4